MGLSLNRHYSSREKRISYRVMNEIAREKKKRNSGSLNLNNRERRRSIREGNLEKSLNDQIGRALGN